MFRFPWSLSAGNSCTWGRRWVFWMILPPIRSTSFWVFLGKWFIMSCLLDLPFWRCTFTRMLGSWFNFHWAKWRSSRHQKFIFPLYNLCQSFLPFLPSSFFNRPSPPTLKLILIFYFMLEIMDSKKKSFHVILHTIHTHPQKRLNPSFESFFNPYLSFILLCFTLSYDFHRFCYCEAKIPKQKKLRPCFRFRSVF